MAGVIGLVSTFKSRMAPLLPADDRVWFLPNRLLTLQSCHHGPWGPSLLQSSGAFDLWAAYFAIRQKFILSFLDNHNRQPALVPLYGMAGGIIMTVKFNHDSEVHVVTSQGATVTDFMQHSPTLPK